MECILPSTLASTINSTVLRNHTPRIWLSQPWLAVCKPISLVRMERCQPKAWGWITPIQDLRVLCKTVVDRVLTTASSACTRPSYAGHGKRRAHVGTERNASLPMGKMNFGMLPVTPSTKQKYAGHSGCQVHVHTGNVVASSIPSCRSRASHREPKVFLRLRPPQAIVSARIATPTNRQYPFFSASSVRVTQRQWMHPRLWVTSLILDLPPARFASTRLLSIILRSRTSRHTLPLPAMP